MYMAERMFQCGQLKKKEAQTKYERGRGYACDTHKIVESVSKAAEKEHGYEEDGDDSF